MSASPDTLDYAPGGRPTVPRAAVKRAVLVVLALASLLPLFFAAQGYTSMKYWGLKLGMTRAEVDRHMWAYTTRPDPWQGFVTQPGQSVVRYELLWFGEWAAMQIIYDANGIVVDGSRLFD